MGTWGTGVFDNDTAMDWVLELVKSDPDFPASVLRLLRDGGPLSTRDCERGLAAGEVIAASCGAPLADPPAEVRAWLEGTGFRADARTLQLAGRVTGMIVEQNAGLTDGHLAPGDSLARWVAPAEDLLRRLSTAQPGPPLNASGSAPSIRRLLEELTSQRGPSGTRAQPGNDQAEYTWRKVRGGLLFSVRDRRGLAVTVDTCGRVAPDSATGLLRHAPLYVWNPDGTWPRGLREFTLRTTCQAFDDLGWHWDDQAEWDATGALVDEWAAADGDDEVIWAALDREHDQLTRLFEECVHRIRSVLIQHFEEQGRPEEAVTFGNRDLRAVEAALVKFERQRIAAKHERLSEIHRRSRERRERREQVLKNTSARPRAEHGDDGPEAT
jgi:hypothetical protein